MLSLTQPAAALRNNSPSVRCLQTRTSLLVAGVWVSRDARSHSYVQPCQRGAFDRHRQSQLEDIKHTDGVL
ncbi:hypothetical protein GGI42DRAFT_331578, partial [Trichoderma sp. SZMC 28013]